MFTWKCTDVFILVILSTNLNETPPICTAEDPPAYQRCYSDTIIEMGNLSHDSSTEWLVMQK